MVDTQKQYLPLQGVHHAPSHASYSVFLPGQYFVISPPASITLGIESDNFLKFYRSPHTPQSLHLLLQSRDTGHLLLLKLVLHPVPQILDWIKVRQVPRPVTHSEWLLIEQSHGHTGCATLGCILEEDFTLMSLHESESSIHRDFPS